MDIINARLKIAKAFVKGVAEMKTQFVEGVEVQRSSGNVFADLELAVSDKLKIKQAW